MKNPLTIHLLIKDNEQTIQKAIASLALLNANILVADLGSKDRSAYLSQKNAKVIRLSLNEDYSNVRNYLVSKSETDWQMYLEPWEILAGGHEHILKAISGGSMAYMMQCVQGDIITKQIRLWHRDLKLKFSNPVYESLVYSSAQNLGVPILIENIDRSEETLKIIETWIVKHPLAIEPYYYQACTLLSQRRWVDFIGVADYYLFREKTALIPLTLLRYYYGWVKCHIFKEPLLAIKHVTSCLAVRPLMAEFWCLLGDIYYLQKEYEEALEFYDNAMILGSRRLKTDDWPMEITKYRDYPQKMHNACKQMLTNTSTIAVSPNFI